MRRRLIRVAAIIVAWVPILILWTVLATVYGRMSFAAALPWSSLTIGSAAVLGIGVWWFCNRTPWPQHVRAGFYARHLLAAFVYALAWIAAFTTVEILVRGTTWRAIASSGIFGWWVIMGLWVYGVIAGISYAIQTQRRAADIELRAVRAEAGLSAAKLDALRSRLHPHFLFNALHTVAALVRQDAAQAESAIEKLGDMLRYTLQDANGELVPFSEEWEFTRRYLEFEQLRYGDRLTVAATIDDDCNSCSAPSFALQTLVENAVRHSIAARPEGGRIEISAHADEARLHVRVRDDGGNGHSSQEGTRFGLHALRERLSAMYGDAAQLSVAGAPAGFEVSFSVPRRGAEDGDDE